MLLRMHVIDTQLDYELISSSIMAWCCDVPAITCVAMGGGGGGGGGARKKTQSLFFYRLLI